MNRFKTFLLNSLLVVISTLMLQIIKLIFSIYVSNNISSEALGVFQLIMSTYIFGITLASSGVNIACTRVVAEEIALKSPNGVKKATSKCILISLILGFSASLIFYTNSRFIVTNCFHNKVSTNIVYLICIALPIISISSAINGYFTSNGRVYKTVIGNFLEQISKIIACILLLKKYLSTGNLEYICYSLILGDVISEIISFTYFVIIYIFDIKLHFSTTKVSTSNNFLNRILKILLPVAMTSYIRSGLSTIKQLIIPSSLEKSGISCEKALSSYGIISGMAMPIVLFPSNFLMAISSLIMPEFARYHIKQDSQKIKLYAHKLIFLTFIFSCFLALFFFIFGRNLGTIIYNNSQVGGFVKIFAPLIPFIYIDIIIDCILKGLDAQVSVMIINILDLLISTSFIFIFVPLFGIKAYIISIYASEILNFILSISKLLKLLK